MNSAPASRTLARDDRQPGQRSGRFETNTDDTITTAVRIVDCIPSLSGEIADGSAFGFTSSIMPPPPAIERRRMDDLAVGVDDARSDLAREARKSPPCYQLVGFSASANALRSRVQEARYPARTASWPSPKGPRPVLRDHSAACR